MKTKKLIHVMIVVIMLGVVNSVQSQGNVAERCKSVAIEVPNTFYEYQELLENHLSACVMSSTINPMTEEAWEREKELIDMNQSVSDVWNRISHLTGQEILIRLKYNWTELNNGSWFIESVRYFVSGFDQLLPPVPANYEFENEVIRVYTTEELAGRFRKLLRKWDNYNGIHGPPFETRGLRCILDGLERLGDEIDDKYISSDILYNWIYNGEITETFPRNEKEVRDRLASSFVENLDSIQDSLLTGYIKEEYVVKHSLIEIDKEIREALSTIATQFSVSGNANNEGMKEIWKFIVKAQRSPKSIYHCYAE